jgi:hypothetical protein
MRFVKHGIEPIVRLGMGTIVGLGVCSFMMVVMHVIGKIVRHGIDTIVRLVWAGHTFMRVVKHGVGPTVEACHGYSCETGVGTIMRSIALAPCIVRHAMGSIVRLAWRVVKHGNGPIVKYGMGTIVGHGVGSFMIHVICKIVRHGMGTIVRLAWAHL